MPRRKTTLRIAISLLAGALCTVAVAWGCGLWSTLNASRGSAGSALAGPGQRLPIETLGELATMIDPVHLPPNPLTVETEAELAETLGFGLRDSNLDIHYSPNNPATYLGRSVASLHRAGWPLPALRCVWIRRTPVTDRYHHGWPPPHWLAREVYWTFPRNRTVAFRPPLPLRPEPLGFAIDTIIYATIILLLWSVPAAARTRRRRHRNQCLTCGYSRANLPAATPCPECGQLALSVPPIASERSMPRTRSQP